VLAAIGPEPSQANYFPLNAASSQKIIEEPGESDAPSMEGPNQIQQTSLKQPIETLPRTPNGGCLCIEIPDGGSRARKKQPKPNVKRALGDGILDDPNLDESKNPLPMRGKLWTESTDCRR
jgi:hypothetical protein